MWSAVNVLMSADETSTASFMQCSVVKLWCFTTKKGWYIGRQSE